MHTISLVVFNGSNVNKYIPLLRQKTLKSISDIKQNISMRIPVIVCDYYDAEALEGLVASAEELLLMGASIKVYEDEEEITLNMVKNLIKMTEGIAKDREEMDNLVLNEAEGNHTSFENELQTLYRKLTQKISDMIPVEWSSFYFNGEVKDGEGGVYFFYKVVGEENEYQYSHLIPRTYQVEKKAYNHSLHELFHLTVQLQNVFMENQQEPWYSVTMIVNDETKLKVHFSYINWNDSLFGPSARIKYFEYKYLSRELADEKDKEQMMKMKRYEENFNSNNQ
ncbi:DUF600 family protein [Priestia aryabhattai]|uniref:immunity protein YezG family protein n=1 Tax=Priestia aryabhattai TaxID=412384 RepID=UPI002E20B3E2|nr:DUF600 family protein [Priestia aryabhattai]